MQVNKSLYLLATLKIERKVTRKQWVTVNDEVSQEAINRRRRKRKRRPLDLPLTHLLRWKAQVKCWRRTKTTQTTWAVMAWRLRSQSPVTCGTLVTSCVVSSRCIIALVISIALNSALQKWVFSVKSRSHRTRGVATCLRALIALTSVEALRAFDARHSSNMQSIMAKCGRIDALQRSSARLARVNTSRRHAFGVNGT